MPRKRQPTIKLGADGLWHAWVTVGTKPNGRPDQRHIKRATETEVEQRADALLAQKQTGKVQRPGRAPNVEQWLGTYLDTIAPRKIDPTTVRGYRSKMRCYVIPEIGKVRMDQLTPEHLDAVYLAMQRAGRADSTMRQVHRILSRALEIAYRRGVLPLNPAKLIDAPTAKAQEIRPPDEAAAARLLAAADEHARRTAARWRIGLALGLRQGEALGLRWSYVDLDAGEIRVWWQLHRRPFDHGCADEPCGRRRAGNCPRRQMELRTGEQRLTGGLILKPPKGKGKRTVPLPPELIAHLRTHREVQDLERMMAGAAYADHDLVFARIDGNPVDPSSDWDEWQVLERVAGVEGQFRVHDGRHFAGTFLLAQGVDVRVVQELLGHSSVKVTEGYTHVASAMARDATKRVGERLFKEGGTP
jgi:integrase